MELLVKKAFFIFFLFTFYFKADFTGLNSCLAATVYLLQSEISIFSKIVWQFQRLTHHLSFWSNECFHLFGGTFLIFFPFLFHFDTLCHIHRCLCNLPLFVSAHILDMCSLKELNAQFLPKQINRQKETGLLIWSKFL